MKPIFSVHAGEYLVATHIEENYKHLNVWLPSKDTGVDMLVTDRANKKTLSVQVKFSKDFWQPGEQHVRPSCCKGQGRWMVDAAVRLGSVLHG